MSVITGLARRPSRPEQAKHDLKREAEGASWPAMVAACAALIVIAVPLLAAACLIVVSLGRPLVFRQVRAGRNGQPFPIVKLRTMHDTRDAGGALLPDEKRLTPAMRFIRRIRIDEAPQLLAILNGEMAFVGPRPLPPSIVDGFGALGRVRGEVRPGLTGWAQVNGNTRLDDVDKLALDIWYVDHRSAALDARILLMTVWTILRGEKLDRRAIEEARWNLDLKRGEFGFDAFSADGRQA